MTQVTRRYRRTTDPQETHLILSRPSASGSYTGKRPKDPGKVASAVLHIERLSEPPLRPLLESDCYAAKKSALQELASDRVGRSQPWTDYTFHETHVQGSSDFLKGRWLLQITPEGANT
jgi:hypothetical protein